MKVSHINVRYDVGRILVYSYLSCVFSQSGITVYNRLLHMDDWQASWMVSSNTCKFDSATLAHILLELQ